VAGVPNAGPLEHSLSRPRRGWRPLRRPAAGACRSTVRC
jgi:hypothetical protein